jgi:O-antigen/teichoic acid export membrane protein
VPDVQGLPSHWLALAALSQIPQAMVAARLALWQAEGRPVRFGMLQVTAAALNVGVSVALVVHLGLGWEGRLLGHLAAISVVGVVAVVSLRSGAMLVWPLDASSSRQALRSMLPLLPYGAGAMILSVSDRLLVANWLDLGQLGIYSAAVQLALPVSVAGEVMNRAVSPWLLERLTRGAPGPRRSTWPVAGAASAAIFLVSAALGAVLFNGAGRLLGLRFDGALAILPYLIAANGVGAVSSLFSIYFLAANRSGLLSSMMTLSLLPLGCMVLLPDLDGPRVAHAFLATQLLLLTSMLAFIPRLSGGTNDGNRA